MEIVLALISDLRYFFGFLNVVVSVAVLFVRNIICPIVLFYWLDTQAPPVYFRCERIRLLLWLLFCFFFLSALTLFTVFKRNELLYFRFIDEIYMIYDRTASNSINFSLTIIFLLVFHSAGARFSLAIESPSENLHTQIKNTKNI